MKKRAGFLSAEDRKDLMELARDGLAEHRVARRANAIVLLDRGMSCAQVARVLLVDDDTIREWRRLYEEDGFDALAGFSYGGSNSALSEAQQETLREWVSRTLPRSTRMIGAFIEGEFGVAYESRSGLIKLLGRLGLEWKKPKPVSSKCDPERQRAFIAAYEKLLNGLGPDEAALFADAVHPTHRARPAGCWAPKDEAVALDQSSGRERLNIHGAVDLETGRTFMRDVLTVDAMSSISLLAMIEAAYPEKRVIHVFLDNARYHHAASVREWLAEPGRRIKLRFIPPYCPHLNPIERLWGLMHRNVTHNRCYPAFADFCNATLAFLREQVPKDWAQLCDSVSDNFRVISPERFRVVA